MRFLDHLKKNSSEEAKNKTKNKQNLVYHQMTPIPILCYKPFGYNQYWFYGNLGRVSVWVIYF